MRRGPVSPESGGATARQGGVPLGKHAPEGPFLLVRGAWRWENGPDLVLRALAPLCREGRLRVVFLGQGPQEDELRYLVDFLGLGEQVWVVTTELGREGQAPEWAAEARAVLDIAGALAQGWRLIRDGVLVANIPFADGDRLKRASLSLEEERGSA
ncbi:MAG: hypothetical protein H5T59_09335 [Anaerolineae bacterium]|nr:hypothetical protein [Anaerolineae bacterium]